MRGRGREEGKEGGREEGRREEGEEGGGGGGGREGGGNGRKYHWETVCECEQRGEWGRRGENCNISH